MKKLSLVFILVAASQLTLAATKSSTSNVSETVHTSSKTDVGLTLGFGLPVLPDSGETAFGFNFGVLARTAEIKGLLFGADMGLHFWGNSSSAAENTTGLQLLPTAVYEFNTGANFVPYLGLSAGPYMFFSPSTRVSFALLFRPGFNWKLSQNLAVNFDARFGQLAGAFLLLPSTSLVINLN